MTPCLRIRQALGLTQHQLAKALGRSQGTVSRLEKTPDLPGDALRALRALGMSRLGSAWRDEWLFAAPAGASEHDENAKLTDHRDDPSPNGSGAGNG
jgi:transcriptional regulator with XRE-family HTH domain